MHDCRHIRFFNVEQNIHGKLVFKCVCNYTAKDHINGFFGIGISEHCMECYSAHLTIDYV